MQYIVDHIDRQKSSFIGKDGKRKYKRVGSKLKPTTYTVHSTDNPTSNALGERKWLENPSNKRQASYHKVVDDKRCVEAIPLNEKALHCGNPTGNSYSAGLEICHSGDREKTLSNASKVVAKDLKALGLGVKDLRRHYDWQQVTNGRKWRKRCPSILSYNNWQGWVEFKTRVEIELRGGMDNMTEKEVKNIVLDITNPSRNGGSPNAHPMYKYHKSLTDRGIVLHERRLDDFITRGEVFAVVSRVLDLLEKVFKKEIKA